jgi:hypothetical protein
MRDHELYATILGLTAPWTVERVEVDVPGGAVHVWLARTGGRGGAVSGVPDRLPHLRPSRAGVAASRHLPAADPAPCPRPPPGLSNPRCGAERRPVVVASHRTLTRSSRSPASANSPAISATAPTPYSAAATSRGSPLRCAIVDACSASSRALRRSARARCSVRKPSGTGRSCGSSPTWLVSSRARALGRTISCARPLVTSSALASADR